MFNESELADNCLEYIDITPNSFNTDGFYETTEDIICEILKRDTLNIMEIDLFRSIIKWAKEQCKRRELSDSMDNLRKILRKHIIQLIRFPLMRIEEFANEVVAKYPKLLNETEIIDLFLYFNINPRSQPSSFDNENYSPPKPNLEFSVTPRYKSILIEHSICRFLDVKSRWGHVGSYFISFRFLESNF